VRWIASRGRAERDALGPHRARAGREHGHFRAPPQRAGNARPARTDAADHQGHRYRLWEYNLAARALHWDEQLYRLVGRTPDDLPDLRREWTSVLHPDDAGRLAKEQRARCATGARSISK